VGNLYESFYNTAVVPEATQRNLLVQTKHSFLINKEFDIANKTFTPWPVG